MKNTLKILSIEDSEDDFDLMMRAVRKAGFETQATRVESEHDLLKALKEPWDVILSDNALPQINAATALELTRAKNQDVPFIIVSGAISEEKAVEAMRCGANDYILKNNLKRLGPAIEREIKEFDNRFKRKTAEKELAKSKEVYRLLTESIEDIFLALDHSLKFTYWNNIAFKETGIREKDVIGKQLYEVFPMIVGAPLEEKILKAIKTQTKQYVSFDYLMKKTAFYEGSIYPFSNGISIILKNVTERKESEENLKAINHELETLMYRLSHDIRGPVASILGLINIGKKDYSGVTFNHFLSLIENSTLRMKNILEELMNITRIKQGDIIVTAVPLRGLIEEIIKNFSYKGDAQNPTFILRVDKAIKINTDIRLIRSIFQNLLENAVKYHEPLKTPKISITVKNENHKTHITIKDNGEGIDPSFHQKIFDMFFRANVSSHGSGLGLYIVKNAVEKLSGTIELESKKDMGTTFKIILPKLKKDELPKDAHYENASSK